MKSELPLAVCPNHGGIIRFFHAPSEKGARFFCPIGKQEWVFDPRRIGMTTPLIYAKELVL